MATCCGHRLSNTVGLDNVTPCAAVAPQHIIQHTHTRYMTHTEMCGCHGEEHTNTQDNGKFPIHGMDSPSGTHLNDATRSVLFVGGQRGHGIHGWQLLSQV